MIDYTKQLNKNELARIENDYTNEQLKQFEAKLIELKSDFENTENIDHAFFEKYFPYEMENDEELESPIPQPMFNPLLYLFLEGEKACFSSEDDQNLAMIESVGIPDWVILRFLNLVPRDDFHSWNIKIMITEGKYSDKEIARQIANILVNEDTFSDGMSEDWFELVQNLADCCVLDDDAQKHIEAWLEKNESYRPASYW
jgi:hypothetical protein